MGIINQEGDEGNIITIGTQEILKDIAARWNIGANTESEQLLFKLSHELAHAYQKEGGFEDTLVNFLNGNNAVSEKHLPYIELYEILSGTGSIGGLSAESMYEEQSRATGDLHVTTLGGHDGTHLGIYDQ